MPCDAMISSHHHHRAAANHGINHAINERSVCGNSVLSRPSGACGKETARDGGNQFDELHRLAMQYLPAIYRLIATQLHDKALDLREIAEVIGCKVETTRAAVNIMHKSRVIHIYEWRRGNDGPPYPAFMLGNEPDCKRPKKLTHSEKCKRWRTKQKTFTAASNMWGIA